ncbi:MAG: WYL domain-containing protein [Christensenellales bacterium]
MPSDSNKKLSILYVLKVLQDYSDENHILSQTDIAQKIEQKYGMRCERKSIGTSIDSLIDIGYDIVKLSNKGSFLASRDFEPSEISFLIDAIFSSKILTSTQAKDLANRLSKYLSVYQRKKYNYIYKSDEILRTDNKQLFYNIDIINEAIEQGKQVSFKYNSYGIDGKLTPRNKGRDYLVNPYFMVNNQGKYYLICNYDYFNDIGNYKIELITDIKIIDNPVKPIQKIVGYEKGLDIAKFINDNVYMFSSKVVNAKVKLNSNFDSTYIHEWFANARITEENGDYFAYVKANEDSIIYWCIQYGDVVEVVEPKDLREKIIKELHNTLNKYEGE